MFSRLKGKIRHASSVVTNAADRGEKAVDAAKNAADAEAKAAERSAADAGENVADVAKKTADRAKKAVEKWISQNLAKSDLERAAKFSKTVMPHLKAIVNDSEFQRTLLSINNTDLSNEGVVDTKIDQLFGVVKGDFVDDLYVSESEGLVGWGFGIMYKIGLGGGYSLLKAKMADGKVRIRLDWAEIVTIGGAIDAVFVFYFDKGPKTLNGLISGFIAEGGYGPNFGEFFLQRPGVRRGGYMLGICPGGGIKCTLGLLGGKHKTYEVTEHRLQLYLRSNTPTTLNHLNPKENSVSPGAKDNSINIDFKEDGRISFNISSENSKKVADWFNEQTKGIVLSTLSSDKVPKELRFAVKFDIWYKSEGQTYLQDDVVIAHGKSMNISTWWIGGKWMEKIENFEFLGKKFHGVGQPVKNHGIKCGFAFYYISGLSSFNVIHKAKRF
jgi:hypothetical protein